MSNDYSVKAPTSFTIVEPPTAKVEEDAEVLLPDRLRKRLQSERKCRPTNEQLDQKLARAEQRRQKQFAKRAAEAREADARCRRVAEAMEALQQVRSRPETRADVMQRFARLQRDLHTVLGRFNSEVERTNCALFAGAPLLAFGSVSMPSSAEQHHRHHLHHHHQQQLPQEQQQQQSHKRRGTAFVVGHSVQAASTEAAADEAAAEMPARLKQRLAAYPRRRSRNELKVALEKKLADAQRRKERYEQRRAESIKETEERCRRISETMEEISLTQEDLHESNGHQQKQAKAEEASASSNSGDYYRRVAKLQVDLDCLFTKFNREIVTVRGARTVDLLETMQPLQQQQPPHPRILASVACQTEPQRCRGCGGVP